MSGINSLTEFNHGLELLDKLDTVLENINTELNWLALTEGAEESPEQEANNQTKKVNLIKAAKNGLEAFIKWAAELIDTMIAKISTFVRGGDSAVAKESFIVSGIVNTSGTLGLIGDDYELEEYEEVTYKAGQEIKLKEIYSKLNEAKKELRIVKKCLSDDKYSPALNTHKTYLKNFIKEISKVIKHAISKKAFNAKLNGAIRKEINVFKKEINKANKEAAKQAKEEYKNSMKEAQARVDKARTSTESIDFDGMTRNEFIANLMLEAADLLKDDVQRDNSEFKEFDEIPEEKPVTTNDYDPEVNGSEGEKVDLEEIKDLCDGDEEVIKLLTGDEDKSVTVNADGSNNESALSFFDIDF